MLSAKIVQTRAMPNLFEYCRVQPIFCKVNVFSRYFCIKPTFFLFCEFLHLSCGKIFYSEFKSKKRFHIPQKNATACNWQ